MIEIHMGTRMRWYWFPTAWYSLCSGLELDMIVIGWDVVTNLLSLLLKYDVHFAKGIILYPDAMMSMVFNSIQDSGPSQFISCWYDFHIDINTYLKILFSIRGRTRSGYLWRRTNIFFFIN